MTFDGRSVINGDLNEDIDKTLQREIKLARNIQMQLLNGFTPKIDSGEVKGSSIPARLIGGDYYDFYPLMNGKLRIVIGDVMGKGIPAAMLMILTRGAFRSASESTKGPAETLTAMNNALCRDLRTLRSFVTVFCADFDPSTGILTYSNAGHPLPFIVDKNEVKEVSKLSGVMLGGLPNQVYKEKEISLGPNDCLFFYTDGIIEAQNSSGEQYKKDRLIDILRSSYGKNVDEIEANIIESIHLFSEGFPQKDDITMVILKNSEEETDITSYNSPVIS